MRKALELWVGCSAWTFFCAILMIGCGSDGDQTHHNNDCNANELYDEESHACVCDRDKNWTGNAGSCTCVTGYELNGQDCVKTTLCGEREISDGNGCLCDTENHWTGKPGSCNCDTGYVQIGQSCELKKECSAEEIYHQDTNTCECDTENHWTGKPGSCNCDTGYVQIGQSCELKKECSAEEIYHQDTNTCECDASKNYYGEPGACVLCNDGFYGFGQSCVKLYDTVKFGRYRQVETPEDRLDSIHWIVLKIEDDRVLLFSKYLVDARRYHDQDVSITWAKSTVRSWLNGLDGSHNAANIDYTSDNFFDTAFNEEEKASIIEVTNSSTSCTSSTSGGEDTRDKVFYLNCSTGRDTEYFKMDDINTRSWLSPYAKLSAQTQATRSGDNDYFVDITHDMAQGYQLNGYWWDDNNCTRVILDDEMEVSWCSGSLWPYRSPGTAANNVLLGNSLAFELKTRIGVAKILGVRPAIWVKR